ncbi:MAG TPA: phage terminase large subunit [Gaiellaceae bacterium]
MESDRDGRDDVLGGLDEHARADLIAELDAADERELRGEELREEAERLKGSLRDFTVAAWPVLEPATAFKPNWHIDAVVDHLEACARREIRKLIINIPPRHMKSLNVSVLWPVWWWTFDPTVRFLTASYGEKLATRDALKSRRLIQSAWFRARYADVFSLTSDQNQKARYENNMTGYRLGTSVGGTGTGEGGDVILIDDPHKADEVESDTERQNVLEWHDGTISTRFNDPERGVEVVVMQRLHEQDLVGHLLEFGGWTHLCLPAEYEPSHPFVWPDDPRSEPGELLWPDHFSREALDDLKVTLGSYRAAGQLQQRPSPAEGGVLKRAWWRYFPPAWLDLWEGPELVGLMTSWDTTMKEKTSSDYAVGTYWGATGANRYLLGRWRDRAGLTETKRALRAAADHLERTHPNLPLTHVVENAANGPEVVAELRDIVQGLTLNSSRTDKMARAQACTPQLEAGNVFVPGFALPDGSGPDPARTPAWVMELVEECAQFPTGTNDDQVDSVTQALLKMRGTYLRTPVRPRDDEPRTQTAGVRAMTF